MIIIVIIIMIMMIMIMTYIDTLNIYNYNFTKCFIIFNLSNTYRKLWLICVLTATMSSYWPRKT